MLSIFNHSPSATRHQLIKFFLLFSLFAFSFLLFANKPSFAQTASVSGTFSNTYPQTPSFSPQSPHTASLAIYNFGHAMSCIMIGQSPIAPCMEYKMYKDARGVVQSTPYLSNVNTNNGVLGASLYMIGEIISTPPVRSSEFIANLGEQIGIKSAHAQVGGSGSGVLSPIFKLWEVSRNIAYLAMILIFILVGLMVMFRQKLNPQTVVSIQIALPGLVIGLVMITFSYFLASLISDLAFVGTNVVGYYFSLAQGTDPKQLPLITRTNTNPTNNYNPRPGTEDNVISIFSRYTNIINTSNVQEPLNSIWPYLKGKETIDSTILSTLGVMGNPSLTGVARAAEFFVNFDAQKALHTLVTMLAVQFVLPFGGLFGGPGQAVAAGGASIVAGLFPIWLVSWSLAFVAMLILIYSMFKLLLRLVNSFLSIIFLTITAPFFFLAASIPGKQGIATTWMFNLLCNVLAFPAVFAVFYFVAFMLGNNNDPLFIINQSSSIAGNATFPLLGGINLKFLNTLVAFGALAALPSVPDIICKAIGKPGQLGGLAAGAIGGAIAQGQRYQGQVQSGTSGFASNVGRLTDTVDYKPEGEDQITGKRTYAINPYASHAGQIAKVGKWWDRKFGRGPHETQVHDSNA